MAYTTRQQLIDRILRYYYNGIPSDSAELSNNEVDLYINDAIASVMNKQIMDEYNISGIMSVPDGYITTYQLTTPSYDDTTGNYYTTIPHPPIGMPNSSGVLGVYFSGGLGQSKPVLYIKPNEMDYFQFMPKPPQAAFYWIEGNKIYFWCRTDLSHTTDRINIRMATNIQSSANDILNVPADAVEQIFSIVTQKLLPRKGIVADVISDGKDRA